MAKPKLKSVIVADWKADATDVHGRLLSEFACAKGGMVVHYGVSDEAMAEAKALYEESMENFRIEKREV